MRKVRVYSTQACPYCKLAKNWLKSNSIIFEEINVEEDTDAASYLVEKTSQTTVPVIEVGNQFIIGFDRPALKQALNLK